MTTFASFNAVNKRFALRAQLLLPTPEFNEKVDQYRNKVIETYCGENGFEYDERSLDWFSDAIPLNGKPLIAFKNYVQFLMRKR